MNCSSRRSNTLESGPDPVEISKLFTESNLLQYVVLTVRHASNRHAEKNEEIRRCTLLDILKNTPGIGDVAKSPLAIYGDDSWQHRAAESPMMKRWDLRKIWLMPELWSERRIKIPTTLLGFETRSDWLLSCPRTVCGGLVIPRLSDATASRNSQKYSLFWIFLPSAHITHYVSMLVKYYGVTWFEEP